MSDSRDTLAVGDSCYIYDTQGKRREAKVTKVARKWVTVHAVGYGACMFDKTNGYSAKPPNYGLGVHLFTLLQDRRRREEDRLRTAARELEAYVRGSNLHKHTAEELEDVASMLENIHHMIKERQT